MGRDSNLSKELMEKIIDVQYKSARQCVSYSKKLLSLSASSCDLYGTAFAYRYLSFGYFKCNKVEFSLRYGKLGCSLAETNNFNDLLPDLYNTLGYIYHIKSLEQMSIECFLRGLEIAKLVNNERVRCYIYSNMGSLYDELKEHKKALYYIKKAYQIVNRECAKDKNRIPVRVRIYRNLLDATVKCNQYAQAEKILKTIEATDAMTDPEDRCSCLYFHALFEFKKGNQEGFIKYFNEGLSLFHQMKLNIMSVMVALDYVDLSLVTGTIKETERLISYAKKGVQMVNVPIFWLRYYKTVIRYYQITGDVEAELDAKESWRFWNKQKRTSEQRQKSLKLEMQEKMKAIQTSYDDTESVRKLINKTSYKDFVTEVYNLRRYLVDLSQSIRQLQIKNENIGMIYIDIDNFKDYNDCFGRIQGDSCLKMIAQAVKECFEGCGLVYRIGNDEFAIILKRKDATIIKKRIERLKQTIYNLKIFHPLSGVSSYLTVSVGAYITVADQMLSETDLCKSANKAISEAKTQGRNGFLIVEGKRFEDN